MILSASTPARWRWPLMAWVIALAGGCASMNQDQCESADWYQQGTEDGLKGRQETRYQDYDKDCGEFAVQVDQRAYLSGWEVGIAEYCTANNGYQQGLEGQSYAQSCPPESADAFYSAYQLGQRLFNQRSRIEALRYELEEVNDDLARDGLTDEQRAVLRRDRRHLRRDIDQEQFALQRIAAEARNQGFPAPY